MNIKLLAVAGVGALALAACGQSTTPATTTDTPSTVSDTSAPPPAAAPVTAADFVTKVAMSDMYEIQASQLANRRAGNAQIRTFAQTMVHDHTATSTQLRGIVRGHADLPLPTALDQAHQDMLRDLTNASAAEFDQKYIDQQTHAHEDAEHLLTDYAQGGDNPDLRSFATETAPKVQHHLDMVRALDHSGADEPSNAHN
ncbi:MAG: DUF4142 domain-containing protein [Vitreimonas sp.]